jgi:hypothetical protein
MSESNMWRFLAQKFKRYGHGDWQRIEDSISMGIPDVNFCIDGVEGWIELKEIPAWPKRKDTIVTFRSPWTKEQRFWARKRGQHNGNIWLLVRVFDTKEYLLFWWKDAVDTVEITLNQQELIDLAVYYRKGGLQKDDFFFTITRGLYSRGEYCGNVE